MKRARRKVARSLIAEDRNEHQNNHHNIWEHSEEQE